LFSPDEAFKDFPPTSLAHLFHTSFWESNDCVAFIIRQMFNEDFSGNHLCENDEEKPEVFFSPNLQRLKWKHKRTYFKLRNLTENHRSKDVIALESGPQVLQGRFTYGPLDMVSLNDEMVDIYVSPSNSSSDWKLIHSGFTNNHGKISFTIPPKLVFKQGLYQIRMIVRGDLSYSDNYLAVVPPQVECVVFSVDGSFATNFSIMGNDPKVRPSAVDVVRRWQDLGYAIVYVTARPEMQKKRVVTWLAQHNFPHGIVCFSDSITSDPLRHKATLLKNLQTEVMTSLLL